GLFRIAYLCIWNLKKICRTNLQFVYGNSKSAQEYEAMVRACFDNIGRSMIDLLYFVERPKKLSKIVKFHNEEILTQALQENRGAIIATAHLGNFPLMFVSLVQRGYKVNVVIRSMREKGFSKFMYDLCALWKIKMIETFPQRHFVKETFSALRRNELLFILLDEVVPQEEGVSVPFFNAQVMRGTGPLLFHERIGSPILPMFMVQDKEGHFDIFVEEPLKVESRFSVEENMVKNISALTETIESFVRKYPTQWGGWLNKRWIAQGVVTPATSK
ncbi:MAG: lysophospholipid acyltransferase family protein, partial [Candidatus Omnitrophica bacterium]|nr:lysophospholipid acyltransferase family protein [Candidatus Omnitrophota bacterium]